MIKILYYLMIFFFPFSSVVVTNKIEGLTLSTVFFAIYYILYILRKLYEKKIDKRIFLILTVLICFLLLQRYLVIIFEIGLDEKLVLVSNESYKNSLLRRSQITQSIYLIFSLMFFYYFYKSLNSTNEIKIKKIIYFSLLVFVLYGYWELIGFLVYNVNVDFISNRIFSEEASANSFQLFNGIRRMDSFAGEPSMYAFTILPFIGYFLYEKKYLFSIILIISSILSTSGTAVGGISVFFLVLFLYSKPKDKIRLLLILLLFFIILYQFQFFRDILSFLIAKFELNHLSGIVRYNNFYNSMIYYFQLPFIFKLIGVGFGTIRSTDMFSTLFVNVGLLGFLLYTYLFFKNLYWLKKLKNGKYLISSLFSLYIVHMVSVPEFSYLSIWVFLGLIYYEAQKIKLRKEKIL